MATTWAGLLGVAALLCHDVVFQGSCLFSILVCPIWLLVSVVENFIGRPGWRIALFRVAIPAVTLGIVLANTAIQWTIAEQNAAHIIKACEEFHVANGRCPKTLDELVPQHLQSIPRAKYCLSPMDSKFSSYSSSDGDQSILWWYKVPFGKEVYDFQSKQWRYID
jgi:hypothetical protein